MNQVNLIGRLTKEPIVNDGNTKVARYTLAVDRRGEGADFISCVTFSKGADFAEKYLHKGMKIAVSGRIQTGSYTNKDGIKVYTTDVIVNEHEFCERKGQTEASGDEVSEGDGFIDVPDDYSGLPFIEG